MKGFAIDTSAVSVFTTRVPKARVLHFEPSYEKAEKCSRTTPFVSNRHTSKAIYINNILIKKVSKTKFLGVIIDDKLNPLMPAI